MSASGKQTSGENTVCGIFWCRGGEGLHGRANMERLLASQTLQWTRGCRPPGLFFRILLRSRDERNRANVTHVVNIWRLTSGVFSVYAYVSNTVSAIDRRRQQATQSMAMDNYCITVDSMWELLARGRSAVFFHRNLIGAVGRWTRLRQLRVRSWQSTWAFQVGL